LVGLTTYGRDEKNNFHLPAEYVEAVRQAGGIPVLLPHGKTDPHALLDRIDALILTGGGDIDPVEYGGTPHETLYMVDSERDKTEIALVRQVVKSGFPTLGICRGVQVINVALGGNLISHLPDVVGEKIKHRLPPREPTPHPIKLDPDSRLAKNLSVTEMSPMSWHHQAVKDLAVSLKAVAHAPDGTVEAVEMPDHPWLIAVQWHAELTAAKDPVQAQLFRALVQFCAGRRRTISP